MIDSVMSLTRAKMFLDERSDRRFYGALAMNLQLVEDNSIPTAAVDGTHLFYNTKFMESLSEPERLGVMVHEVLHCAFGHFARLGARNRQKANIAMDLVINPILKNAGYQLPKGCLFDKKYDDMYWEQVYSLLPDPPVSNGTNVVVMVGVPTGQCLPTPSPGSNDKNEDGDGTGADGEIIKTEQDWQIAVDQALQVAAMAGKIPGGFESIWKKQQEARVDWREQTREFIQSLVPNDTSWSTPNRRFIHMGMFLPGVFKTPQVGTIVFAMDTSGSTGGMRQMFVDEFVGMVQEVRPAKLWEVYCDYVVAKVVERDPDDFDPQDIRMAGEGGTRFSPVFEWVEEQGIEPQAVIYITDLEGDLRFPEPPYPVLWVTPDYVRDTVPWGIHVKVPMET